MPASRHRVRVRRAIRRQHLRRILPTRGDDTPLVVPIPVAVLRLRLRLAKNSKHSVEDVRHVQRRELGATHLFVVFWVDVCCG